MLSDNIKQCKEASLNKTLKAQKMSLDDHSGHTDEVAQYSDR
jgi:hypothetical protein